MIRSFPFTIEEQYARLVASLPNQTSIYHEWPRQDLRASLPDFLSIATMTLQQSPYNPVAGPSYVLMGMPVHVVQHDRLQMNIMNKLQSTGLSIHFHGFEMANAIEYDGVVGLTQCAIPPGGKFSYNFKVEEMEGLYWYHTHSGNLGVESHNMIKAPLVVHPDTFESRKLVDELNSFPMNKQVGDSIDYRHLLSYGNERILFISDGFLKSDTMIEMYSVGGLNPPIQLNDDGFVAAVTEYQFGTVNGKLREIIHVVKGEVYKFRLLNGGSHFGFRISIDGFPMIVVAADSYPVKPYEVDEVILHNAERFDVEVRIPYHLDSGDVFWIRADTLESRKHGYQNGIRAILHVVDSMDETIALDDNDIMDPKENIVESRTTVEERRTMNCYSNLERQEATRNGKGACLPINALESLHTNNHQEDISTHNLIADERRNNATSIAVRTVDFDSNKAPLHAYFTRIENDKWYQHVLGVATHLLRPDFDQNRDLHPHTAVMNVPSNSPVIIIWRSRSTMEHPMHLHGYKMEILETYAPKPETNCNLAKCKLPDVFDSLKKRKEFERIPVGSRPIKDTFIMPAGGAVATRIFTRGPAPWLAHCHTEVHHQDGMGFIMNVGEYSAPSNGSWLPQDFPSCKSPFHKSQSEEPHCDCYVDNDAVLDLALDETYKCSRSYLCMWQKSQVAVLRQADSISGYRMQSSYSAPGWVISLSLVCIVAAITLISTIILPCCRESRKPSFENSIKQNGQPSEKHSYWDQFSTLLSLRWSEYRPTTINTLRVVEVVGLGLLTGFLFQDVGKNSTATGLGEKTSLLFFSTTLWCQTRMYPAISNYFEFKHNDVLMVEKKQYNFLPVFLSRMVVVTACEAWWPMLFVVCAYPLASMFGNLLKVLIISIFLVLNNSCYIAIGALVGTLMPTVNLGMIGATLFGQTTVICAGFFTKLPPFVGWIRYISPIFYAFKGIVKTAYSWDDTYACPKGHSAVGPNKCFLETSPTIDNYKQRGINVATFGDPSSSRVHVEAIIMIFLSSLCQVLMFCYLKLVLVGKEKCGLDEGKVGCTESFHYEDDIFVDEEKHDAECQLTHASKTGENEVRVCG